MIGLLPRLTCWSAGRCDTYSRRRDHRRAFVLHDHHGTRIILSTTDGEHKVRTLLISELVILVVVRAPLPSERQGHDLVQAFSRHILAILSQISRWRHVGTCRSIHQCGLGCVWVHPSVEDIGPRHLPLVVESDTLNSIKLVS